MPHTRPVTSRPRGVCRFYNSSTGCLAGRTCKFLHGDDKLTPFDKAKTCKFFVAGFCKRGADCWFVHEQPQSSSPPQEQNLTDDQPDDELCCICLEKPLTFGLLSGCSHMFCVGCIREWRDPSGKSEEVVSSGVTKKCPLCRASSQFVTPSSHFYPQDHSQKAVIIEQYKASMSRVPCKYFEISNKRYCPFGKDCFYQHLKSDGTPHVSRHGVTKSIQVSTPLVQPLSPSEFDAEQPISRTASAVTIGGIIVFRQSQ
ncbi:hypothetical protein BDY19DRAFT_885434 [Irpex rosettiformis]|uniref:Uncharacterized protein n=1 Tax=Irpex rosettiformis TaxID=378272 RepID=A0ACB8UCA2_9APHY|nr:hypothetical protein BDY19DRAFT_885434 [Irpex rosettiformis]